ncbi:SWIM zinc finger family protein [Streptomyces sp. NBC_00237]|uniref:SWIM zinc finger family protein n=1 Tax=Streptomyces sp. NBC_00237 TaxID=2975687 RepID=UPI00225038F8|nr:SWIM zinc finger family protein [Streptomyces sp. NBC_00237]MCX5204731.1 SWIM zinc finger family protein [Streptomyces sp. NBC_00237]
MNQLGVRWTADQVLALAPDAASRKAGSRLGAAGPWSEAGCDGAGALWGLCKGSGSRPYQTVVDLAGAGAASKCSCPSRKFPCKHALGLLLLWAAEDPAVTAGAEPAAWAEEWLRDRRERTAAQTEGTAPEPGGAPAEKTADPEAARRRAERRAARIGAGASELEQRLADLLRGGLAAAEREGHGLWEETAARMVDAQAPGLAARVRELGSIPSSGPGWPVRLLEECALLHLLDGAWLGRDRLPEELATTVRTRVGLPSSPDGSVVRDRWLVLAQYDQSDGKVTTRRIWLYGQDSGRTALVLSFGAAGRAPEISLPVGLAVEAELLPHGGAGQLRATLGDRFGTPHQASAPPPGGSVTEAVEAYSRALREDPWLESWPVTLGAVVPGPGPSDGGWQLADAEGGLALPVSRSALGGPGLWKLAGLSGGAPLVVFGECGYEGFRPLAAWAPDSGEPIPLL